MNDRFCNCYIPDCRVIYAVLARLSIAMHAYKCVFLTSILTSLSPHSLETKENQDLVIITYRYLDGYLITSKQNPTPNNLFQKSKFMYNYYHIIKRQLLL